MPTVAVLVLYTVHCYNAFPSTGREFFPPKTQFGSCLCIIQYGGRRMWQYAIAICL